MPGRHQNDAVGGPDAIDGGGSILQDGDIVNLIGIHPGEISFVAGDAVHNDQRVSHAADVNGVVKFTRLGGILGNADAGDFTGKHIKNVLVLGDSYVLTPDG